MKDSQDDLLLCSLPDSRADARILKIQQDDVILAITSAGDNILAYALEKPKRIHAVDLK